MKYLVFYSPPKLNLYCLLDEAAQEALTDMPPRSEEELDPVTLHNQALMNMETNPTEVRHFSTADLQLLVF